MNKGRITYRFDPKGNRTDGASVKEAGYGEQGQVIPLRQGEYEVVVEKGTEGVYRGNLAEKRHFEHQEAKPDSTSTSDSWDSLYTEKADVERKPRDYSRPVRDYRELNQFTTDFGAWSSPYDAETERIEDMIRESNERQGRTAPVPHHPEYPVHGRREPVVQRFPNHVRQEPTEPELYNGEPVYDGESGYYDQGGRAHNTDPGRSSPRGYRDYREERFEGPAVEGPRYVRHSRPPWMKITVSIAGAAVTGIMLGFFALSLFSGGSGLDKENGNNNPISQPVTGTVQENTAGVGATIGQGQVVASGQQSAFNYAGRTYSFLQYGIFTGQQGADQAQNELLKSGLAAAYELSDKYYVFAGLATDLISAKALGQQMKDSGQVTEIYAKDFVVPAITSVRWNGNTDTLQSYLEQSDQLLQSINLLTVMNLENDTPAGIDASTMQSITATHTAWVQLSNTVSQEAGEETKAIVQRMNNAMNSAKASLDEYRKNNSTSMLWQSQTYMLQFVIAQKQLLQIIGA